MLHGRVARLRQAEIKQKDKQEEGYVTIVNSYSIRYAVRSRNGGRRYRARATSATICRLSHSPIMGVESSKKKKLLIFFKIRNKFNFNKLIVC